MMNFPDSPTANQVFSSAGLSWTWDGTKWKPSTAGGGGTVVSVAAGTGLTGTPNPISSSGTIALTTPVTVANGGTGAGTLTGLVTGNGTAPMTPTALPLSVANGGTGAATAPAALTSLGAAPATGGSYVAKAGDTMTGALLVNTTNAAGAVTANANATPMAPVFVPWIVQGNINSQGIDATSGGGLNLAGWGTPPAAAPFIQMMRGRGTAATPAAPQGTDILGSIYFEGVGNATTPLTGAVIQGLASSNWTTSNSQSQINFSTTPSGSTGLSVRMTLGAGLQVGSPAGGDLGPGTINASDRVQVHPAGSGYAILQSGDASNAGYVSFWSAGGTQQGWVGYGPDGVQLVCLNGNLSLQCSGYPSPTNSRNLGNTTYAFAAVCAYSYPTPSDRKDKVDIAPLPDCIDLVKAIEPKRFRYTNGPEDQQARVRWGFIADEVGAATTGHKFGGFIDRDSDDGVQALEYSDLTSMLWKAVQELAQRLEKLEQR